MLGGRVKTLHPRIHAGILARRDNDEDVATLEEHEIEPFDLVCINLYPVRADRGAEGHHRARGRRDDRRRRPVDAPRRGEELRACRAASAGRSATGSCSTSCARNGELSLDTRRELAAEAFATSAAYEAAIATWFSERETFPDTHVSRSRRCSTSRTARTRTSAPRTTPSAAHARICSSRVEQLHGKALSFNNLNDLSARAMLAREFTLPACVIVKHANPCGVGDRRDDRGGVRQSARVRSDSAYGGIVVLNREVDDALAEKLAEQFVEVLFAPGYATRRSPRCSSKQNIRILIDHERRRDDRPRHYKRVLGGLLVQDPDTDIEDREGWQVVAGVADEQQWGDLVFAWRVCKHVSSNAIVLAKDLQTIGIGAGQMSRVDAVRSPSRRRARTATT